MIFDYQNIFDYLNIITHLNQSNFIDKKDTRDVIYNMNWELIRYIFATQNSNARLAWPPLLYIHRYFKNIFGYILDICKLCFVFYYNNSNIQKTY